MSELNGDPVGQAVRTWTPGRPFNLDVLRLDGTRIALLLDFEGFHDDGSGKDYPTWTAYGPAGLPVPWPLLIDTHEVPDWARIFLATRANGAGERVFAQALTTCN